MATILTDADIQKLDAQNQQVLTDADIEKLDSQQSALTDQDIANLDNQNQPLTDADILKLDQQKTGVMGNIGKALGDIATAPAVPINMVSQDPSLLLKHPLEAAGLKTPGQVLYDKYGTKPEGERWTPAFIRSFLTKSIADTVDMATNPLSYAGGEAINAGLSTKPVQMFLRKQVPLFANPTAPLFRPLTSSEERYAAWLKNPAASLTPTELVKEQTDPINKIITALSEAKPIRGKQEALYSAERSKRFGALSSVTTGGEAGLYERLGKLRGQLPKAQFEGIGNKLTQADITTVFDRVWSSGLQEIEKTNAAVGLLKLIGVEGGAVPTNSELSLLSEVFPQKFVDTVLSKRTTMEHITATAQNVINVPRAIMASIDLSGLLRQGWFALSHPKQALPASVEMFKYAFSEKAYQNFMQSIEQRPTYELMKRGGLSLTKLGGQLTNREEAFQSNLAEQIPGIGKFVRGSGRAYTGFLDKVRVDLFDDLLSKSQKEGVEVNEKFLTSLGSFINNATGRGELGALEKHAVALNNIFFSPRLIASRVNLLNPVYYAKLHPFVRKEALKSLATMTGIATTTLGLAKAGGADVVLDPRNADFGKIKVGNTRYDVLGGFGQYIRAMSQLITGVKISSTTGVRTTVGEGYKPLNRFGIAQQFLESKESPVVSFATTMLRGQDITGKKANVSKEIASRFIPMVIQDLSDLVAERGIEGIPMSIPGIFGVGVQTYKPDGKEMVYSANSVLSHSKELAKQGRWKEAEDLMKRNETTIMIGKSLEPLQKTINEYDKNIDFIKKNVTIDPETKKSQISEMEKYKKSVEDVMENNFKNIKKQYGMR